MIIRSTMAMGLALMGACLLSACNNPHRDNGNEPAILVRAAHHTMETGERIAIHATTVNLVAASPVKWTVSPSTAQVTAGGNGLEAMFTANEPGTYVITANADAGNGRIVEDSTNVVVNGPTMRQENAVR